MQERYRRLHAACDHRGLFQLFYLRTTQAYRRASLEPGFFQDTAHVNREDRVFARLYFDAFDDWEAGRRKLVPPAWRLSFKASTQQSVNSVGDALLGVSAHINRDLPFALAAIGLADPATGISRKPDHDRVNRFLARVPAPLFRQVHEQWDPSFTDWGDSMTPLAIGVIQAWREAAWRWAERLVRTRTPSDRRQVEAQIEVYAYNHGLAILNANRYQPGENSSARDAYCRSRQRGR
jgi:hypothetical protein